MLKHPETSLIAVHAMKVHSKKGSIALNKHIRDKLGARPADLVAAMNGDKGMFPTVAKMDVGLSGKGVRICRLNKLCRERLGLDIMDDALVCAEAAVDGEDRRKRCWDLTEDCCCSLPSTGEVWSFGSMGESSDSDEQWGSVIVVMGGWHEAIFEAGSVVWLAPLKS